MAKTNGIEIPAGFKTKDLSNWKMKDFRRFQRVVQDAQKDIRAYFVFCGEVLESWPFEGDPSDPDTYEDLNFDEWAQVDHLVGEVVGGYFRR